MMHQVEIDSQELVKNISTCLDQKENHYKISTSKRRNRTMLMNMKELLKVADEKDLQYQHSISVVISY